MSKVAVIGMACRFPCAPDVDTFWANLVAGHTAIRRFSTEEVLRHGCPAADTQDPNYVPVGAPIDGIDEFDARYFGITPREADLMDPQHRLFLQCAATALEASGHIPDDCGPTGVYAASSFNSYMLENVLLAGTISEGTSEMEALIAGEKDYLATRVSYRLGLSGPSLSVQTACSSGLVAVHLASEAVLSGECDMALAGAVSVNVGQQRGYRVDPGDIRSPTGRCRPFDLEADGTVFGSGVGAVVLRRLEDAERAGDTIYGVIRGSALNNDGSHKAGFTAPSRLAQAAVVRAAQLSADVGPDDVSYVEAHGTGTPMGDYIEVSALAEVFAKSVKRHCSLGAVSSNIGHLDVCAGLAGLIKTLLCVYHSKLVPTPGFASPNSAFTVDGAIFDVVTSTQPWTESPRIAGVSSFGIGGTNAHVVVEEAPRRHVEPDGDAPTAPWLLLPVSGNSVEAVRVQAAALSHAISRDPLLPLHAVATTLQRGRRSRKYRGIALGRSRDELCAGLAALVPAESTAAPDGPTFVFEEPPVVRAGLAARWLNEEPIFRRAVHDVADALPTHRSETLQALEGSAGESWLGDAAVLETSLFTVSYAIAKWLSRIVASPTAVVGQGVGELTAAAVADVMSLDDAALLVSERAALLSETSPQYLLVVRGAQNVIHRIVDGRLATASMESDDEMTFVGPPNEVGDVAAALRLAGIEVRTVAAGPRFRAIARESASPKLRSTLEQISLRVPTILLLSASNGGIVTPSQACSADYWARLPWQRPNLSRALEAAPDGSPQLFVFDRSNVHPGSVPLSVMSTADLTDHDTERPTRSLTALGSLWTMGFDVKWHMLGSATGEIRIPLPTYPFATSRHWLLSEPHTHGRSDSITSTSDATLSDVGLQTVAAEESSQPPQSHTLSRLVVIWEELLGTTDYDLKQNFTALGGHSLLAARLVGRIRREFGVRIPLSVILESGMIEDIAATIDETADARHD